LFSILAVELLESMLNLDTDKRLTAEQALAHPYLATYADPEDEVCYKMLIVVFSTFLMTGWENLVLTRKLSLKCPELSRFS